jgi:elongation factor P
MISDNDKGAIMADIQTNQLKAGVKVLIDGDPCNIMQNEYVKPGKGQAFNRIKFRNLLTGRVLEKTLKSGDSLPQADAMEVEMGYIFADDEFWYFMDPGTYEQLPASKDAMGETVDWIKSEDVCQVTVYNGAIISVVAPNFVELEVIDCEPALKGDTVSGGSKTAKLETGKVIRVPLFVNLGDKLKIDTRTGEYVSRIK